MTFQSTLAFFSQRVTTQRTRARFPSVQADDDDDEDSSLEDSCEEPLDHTVRQPPHPSIGQQKQPEISAEQRRRQKWLKWANRIECVHLDDQSIYTLGNEGLICRICHSHRNHLKYSREEYIVRPARPTHVNSVLGHIHTETHARALSLWLIDLDRIRQAAEVSDEGWTSKHVSNQFRAANQICHRKSSINDFKSLTNLLDSIVCPANVSDSHKTNYIRFWELADTLDRIYERRLFSEITTLTPLSLTLDISTDITSISVLCVNLRFFSKDQLARNILVGLSEMQEGTTGLQIFTHFMRVVARAGIDPSQIVSVASDGDPAMTGHNSGFVAQLNQHYPHILFHQCETHKFQLAQKDAFQTPQDSISATLIHHTALLINFITRSHHFKKRFATLLTESGLAQKKLTKPVQVRWSTCQSTVSQVLKYIGTISQPLSTSDDQKIQQIVAFFNDNLNLLRLGGLSLLLSQANEINLILQKRDLHLAACSDIIENFKTRLSAITPNSFRPELKKIMIENKHNQCTPFLDQVSRECSELAQKFKANITSRFSQRTAEKELYLWSHDNLISQDTSMSDNDVLKMAERLRRFVPQIIQQHTLTHWKQLKSTYQLNFAMAQLSRNDILSLILTDPLFTAQSAIHPLLRAIRTIHCTTVETEREFSILHYIKRKERNRLTTEHLAVLSRVAHNAPPLIPPDDMEMLLEENKRSTIKPVKRDCPDISDWNL